MKRIELSELRNLCNEASLEIEKLKITNNQADLALNNLTKECAKKGAKIQALSNLLKEISEWAGKLPLDYKQRDARDNILKLIQSSVKSFG